MNICIMPSKPENYRRLFPKIIAFINIYAKTSRRTGNRTRKNNVFLKNRIFAIAKQTFLQAELCQILGREFGKIRVSGGFWIHFIGACWQAFSFFLFRAGASALKLFFAGDGYADSHISTASTSHRGEDLCSLNTTSWGWSLWQHSMRHRLFQCGNWFSPFHALATHVSTFQHCGPMFAKMQHYQTSVQRSNM